MILGFNKLQNNLNKWEIYAMKLVIILQLCIKRENQKKFMTHINN